MKKKILLMAMMIAVLVCAMLCVASAQEAHLEEIPDNLLFSDDTVTHFIVFDDEKYYTGSGNKLDGLNVENIESSLTSLGVTKDMIGEGKTYLTKFVFPAYLNETLITYIDVNSSIKSNAYFSNVCGYVSFPGTMTTTHDMNQRVEQLRGIDFGEGSKLTAIPSYFANEAKKLKEVKNFPTANLESIGSYAFNNATLAFSGELYINAKYVYKSAFNNATTYVTSLVFGENLIYLGTQSFSIRKSETGLCDPLLKCVEFKSNVVNIKTESYGPFYFELGGNSRTEYASLKCIILSNEENKNTIVNETTTFNDIAPASYIRFLSDETKEYIHSSHEIGYENSTISYESFLKNGTLTGYCTRCNNAGSESTAPLFTCLGYSAPEDGIAGIAIGFTVNNAAIAEYEKVTGKTLKYGVFAVLQKRLGDKGVFAQDGTVAEGVINAEITNYEFAAFELKIVGFTDNQKDTKLAMGAYVAETDGETTEYSYMQSGTPAENEKYCFVSYNDIVPTTSSEDDEVTQ